MKLVDLLSCKIMLESYTYYKNIKISDSDINKLCETYSNELKKCIRDNLNTNNNEKCLWEISNLKNNINNK